MTAKRDAVTIKWTVRALLLSVMLAAVQIATGWTQAASAGASAEASSELSGTVQIAGSPIAGSK
jgi:ABC-type phosphate transport system substrate-binding protein